MINQKMISLKLDQDSLVALDCFCDSRGLKRNRVLNDLVRSLLSNMSTYQITRLIAAHAPDLLSLWYKDQYNIDFNDN